MNRSLTLSARRTAGRWRWLGVLPAIALAGLSLAQAAAAGGLPVRWAGPLGPSFHAWQPGLKRLEDTLLRPGPTHLDTARLRQAERVILQEQPLSTAALRLGAWSAARQGREDEALERIRLIERISRRDTVAQLWLIEDAVRRDDIPGVLRRYDAVMRTQADLRGPLLTKLAEQLGGDPVRLALAKYADARSPWFPHLLRLAGTKGHAKEAAALLIGLPDIPDTALYRSAYATVVAALVEENGFALLRGVYPRLPGTGAGSLIDVGLSGAGQSEGYAPLRWSLASSADSSARQEADALAVHAEPFSRGQMASRFLLLPPDTPFALAWTVETEGRSSTDAAAHWTIRCRDTGRSVRSPDLLGTPHGDGILALPHSCEAADLALIVDGGTGGEGPAFRLTRLRLLSTLSSPDLQPPLPKKMSLQ